MTLAYKRFTDVLLLIYGSLFLSGVYYCLSVFWCAVATMLELDLELPVSEFLASKQITMLNTLNIHRIYPPLIFICSQS
jgi:hypothetical protein